METSYINVTTNYGPNPVKVLAYLIGDGTFAVHKELLNDNSLKEKSWHWPWDYRFR